MNHSIRLIFQVFLVATFLTASTWIAEAASKQKRVLVVTTTTGFRHSSIETAEKVLEKLGKESGAFTVEFARVTPPKEPRKPSVPKDTGDAEKLKVDTEKYNAAMEKYKPEGERYQADLKSYAAEQKRVLAEKMSPDALKNYDGVIFANTTGDLPLPDKEAFLKWIQSGKAFIGMHSASDTFHGYPAFIDMIGGEFVSHGPQVGVECINEDPEHPATKHLGAKYPIYDEIYILKNFHREKVHGLLTLDKEPNKLYPGDFPIAWCKQVGRGKLFYTSLGHREDVWLSENYQQHIMGGIKWALGLADGESKPQNLAAKLSKEEDRDGFKLLFNGTDLKGWKLRNAEGEKSWSVQNGMLVNTIKQGAHGTDLVSDEKFKDFVIRYDYMVPSNSNSGLYLRGRYEIQIAEDLARKKPSPGSNGGLYNTAAGTEFVSRPAGQWQS